MNTCRRKFGITKRLISMWEFPWSILKRENFVTWLPAHLAGMDDQLWIQLLLLIYHNPKRFPPVNNKKQNSSYCLLLLSYLESSKRDIGLIHTSQLWFSISAQGTKATLPSSEGNLTCNSNKQDPDHLILIII